MSRCGICIGNNTFMVHVYTFQDAAHNSPVLSCILNFIAVSTIMLMNKFEVFFRLWFVSDTS